MAGNRFTVMAGKVRATLRLLLLTFLTVESIGEAQTLSKQAHIKQVSSSSLFQTLRVRCHIGGISGYENLHKISPKVELSYQDFVILVGLGSSCDTILNLEFFPPKFELIYCLKDIFYTRKYPLRGYFLAPPGRRKRITMKFDRDVTLRDVTDTEIRTERRVS